MVSVARAIVTAETQTSSFSLDDSDPESFSASSHVLPSVDGTVTMERPPAHLEMSDDFGGNAEDDTYFRRIRFSLCSLFCFLGAFFFGVFSFVSGTAIALQTIGSTCACTLPGLFLARMAKKEEDHREEEGGEVAEGEEALDRVAKTVPIVGLVLNGLALLVFTAAQVVIWWNVMLNPK